MTEQIVTQAQAQALRDFAAKRERARVALLGHEERFRFMRGFNDFFFATGVVMLGAGMMYFAGPGSGGNLAAAVVVWGLAELLVRRMRLVLPGLLLACFFVALIYRAIPADRILNLLPDRLLISSALTQVPPRRYPATFFDMFFGGRTVDSQPRLSSLRPRRWWRVLPPRCFMCASDCRLRCFRWPAAW